MPLEWTGRDLYFLGDSCARCEAAGRKGNKADDLPERPHGRCGVCAGAGSQLPRAGNLRDGGRLRPSRAYGRNQDRIANKQQRLTPGMIGSKFSPRRGSAVFSPGQRPGYEAIQFMSP